MGKVKTLTISKLPSAFFSLKNLQEFPPQHLNEKLKKLKNF